MPRRTPYHRFVCAITLVLLLTLAPHRAYSCDTVAGCSGNELRCSGGGGAVAHSTPRNRFDSTAFTLELWFRVTPSVNAEGLIGKSDPAGPHLTITIDTASRIVLDVQNTYGYQARVISRTGFVDGAWHHLAAVRTGEELDLILDATLEGSAFFPASTSIANDSDLLIGAAAAMQGRLSLTGYLDEVRIWNTAIPLAQLACRRFDRLTGSEPSLTAYYPFDDSIGRRSSCDRSSFNNDAQLGPATDITGPTRAIPQPIRALSNSLTLLPATACSDTAHAVLRIVTDRPCGSMIQSIAITGPDRQSFTITQSTPIAIAAGDTLTLDILCGLRANVLHAAVEITTSSCPDPLAIAVTADAKRAPRTTVDRDTLAFARGTVGVQAIDTVFVSNSGSVADTLDVIVDTIPLSLFSASSIALAPGERRPVLIAYAPVADVIAHGELRLRSRNCGDSLRVALIGAGADSISTVHVCAESITIRAGDTADISLSIDHPIAMSTSDVVSIVITFDARQLGILDARGNCGVSASFDTVGNSSSTTLNVAGCPGSLTGAIATLRIVALAPDSTNAVLHVDARFTPQRVTVMPCSSTVTIIPRCDIPRVVYTSVPATLLPVTPNPVGNAATIAFTIQERGRVRIQLVDVYGREIARVLDDELPAGAHSATLDAARLQLRPGTYYCSLRAGSYHAVRCLTVLR